MMANADKVAAEANAAAIAEDVGIVQGASADALGIGAGAAETLADVTNDLCDMGALTGTRTSRSGKIKVHVASKSTVALYVVLGVLAAITVFALVVMDYGKVSFPAAMAVLQETVPDFVLPIVEQGVRDGSIQTDRPREFSEVIVLLANLWVSPMFRSATAEELRARVDYYLDIVKALGGLSLEVGGLATILEGYRSQFHERLDAMSS